MILTLLFPPKCILCGQLLSSEETDLCHSCRKNEQEFTAGKRKIPFVAHWTAMWYYSDNVRKSIHRFKFYHTPSYGVSFGRLLAMKLVKDPSFRYDLVTWVPTTPFRLLRRGYDQAQLVAAAVSREISCSCLRTLRRTRNTPPQSRLKDAAMRRANVQGAYAAVNADQYTGKRILLIDDVVTTGATASECAKTLLIAGAAEVHIAAVAAAAQDKTSR